MSMDGMTLEEGLRMAGRGILSAFHDNWDLPSMIFEVILSGIDDLDDDGDIYVIGRDGSTETLEEHFGADGKRSVEQVAELKESTGFILKPIAHGYEHPVELMKTVTIDPESVGVAVVCEGWTYSESRIAEMQRSGAAPTQQPSEFDDSVEIRVLTVKLRDGTIVAQVDSRFDDAPEGLGTASLLDGAVVDGMDGLLYPDRTQENRFPLQQLFDSLDNPEERHAFVEMLEITGLIKAHVAELVDGLNDEKSIMRALRTLRLTQPGHLADSLVMNGPFIPFSLFGDTWESCVQEIRDSKISDADPECNRAVRHGPPWLAAYCMLRASEFELGDDSLRGNAALANVLASNYEVLADIMRATQQVRDALTAPCRCGSGKRRVVCILAGCGDVERDT